MRILVLMPVRDAPEAATLAALRDNADGATLTVFTETGLPVDIARNRLAARARAVLHAHDLVLWVDADAWWPKGTFTHIATRMRRLKERDLLASFHCARRAYAPVNGSMIGPDGAPALPAIPIIRAAPDWLLPVTFAGSHFYAHRPALLAILDHTPFSLLPVSAGEDGAFCRRVILGGGTIYIDGRLAVFHVENGVGFLPGRGPFRFDGTNMIALGQAPPNSPEEMKHAPFRRYGETVDEARRGLFARNGVTEEEVISKSADPPKPVD